MKYSALFLICFAGFYSQSTRAQNYTRPLEVVRNCTSVTVSSVVFSSIFLPWGFDWRISDGVTTKVLVSVTIPNDARDELIITSGPRSTYSTRYAISNTPHPVYSASTPFTSTVTIELLKGERLYLSVPGLQSAPISRPVCELNDAHSNFASEIVCETDPCTYESKANLTCSVEGLVETTCGCDGRFLKKCSRFTDGQIAGFSIATLSGAVALVICYIVYKKYFRN